ncbi:MAG: lipoyl(octanoyl) transferase LipB [Parasphingorhabdus sp.]|nr:lipoyl(octanoyl) transferase LipB [Parasphingorhabdus sp.]
MNPDDKIEWRVDDALQPYAQALATMEARNRAVQARSARELVWLIEHPPLYTAGTSADPAELRNPQYPVFDTGRGGRYTYHGPGQRVGYLVLNLAQRKRDVRGFVAALEHWIIASLSDFDVHAWQAPGRIGIWCRNREGTEAKIGAIGIRIRRWVTMHGFAVNVAPELEHFTGIVPCGISEFPVTSLAALGIEASLLDFDAALRRHFPAFLRAISADMLE